MPVFPNLIKDSKWGWPFLSLIFRQWWVELFVSVLLSSWRYDDQSIHQTAWFYRTYLKHSLRRLIDPSLAGILFFQVEYFIQLFDTFRLISIYSWQLDPLIIVSMWINFQVWDLTVVAIVCEGLMSIIFISQNNNVKQNSIRLVSFLSFSLFHRTFAGSASNNGFVLLKTIKMVCW